MQRIGDPTTLVGGRVGEGQIGQVKAPYVAMALKLGQFVQGDYVGFNTGNGEKLSYNQAAGLAWSAWL